MSFGYGIGDFLAVLKLANDVRKRFFNAPAQFKAISEDIKSLSNVLRDIDDIEPNNGLNKAQKDRLNEISQGCHTVLQDLEGMLDRYQDIGNGEKNIQGRSRRTWKRLKWDTTEINGLQQRICERIDGFNLFLTGLSVHVSLATKEITIQTKHSVDRVHEYHDDQKRDEMLNWLSLNTYAAQQSDLCNQREEGTGKWLLSTSEFQQWVDGREQMLFCPGIPGAGKTTIVSAVVDHLHQKYYNVA
ncbi:hypothetical protein ASPWEDRAFT_143525, partial [Aspergillus wentii DTO 134E9]